MTEQSIRKTILVLHTYAGHIFWYNKIYKYMQQLLLCVPFLFTREWNQCSLVQFLFFVSYVVLVPHS